MAQKSSAVQRERRSGYDLSHCGVQSGRGLRSGLERQCLDYYARRADACIVEQLESTAALLQQEKAGSRYELYLIELPAANPCSGLQAAQ